MRDTRSRELPCCPCDAPVDASSCVPNKTKSREATMPSGMLGSFSAGSLWPQSQRRNHRAKYTQLTSRARFRVFFRSSILNCQLRFYSHSGDAAPMALTAYSPSPSSQHPPITAQTSPRSRQGTAHALAASIEHAPQHDGKRRRHTAASTRCRRLAHTKTHVAPDANV